MLDEQPRLISIISGTRLVVQVTAEIGEIKLSRISTGSCCFNGASRMFNGEIDEVTDLDSGTCELCYIGIAHKILMVYISQFTIHCRVSRELEDYNFNYK